MIEGIDIMIDNIVTNENLPTRQPKNNLSKVDLKNSKFFIL